MFHFIMDLEVVYTVLCCDKNLKWFYIEQNFTMHLNIYISTVVFNQYTINIK
jgi:hypothetical protein